MSTRHAEIAIIGGCRVGKTAMVSQLISAIFEKEYIPTADDSHVAMLHCGRTAVKLTLHDTSGGQKFAGAKEDKYTTAEGFLSVYSIASRPSFDELQVFVERLQEVLGTKKVPIVIIGNKLDLKVSREVDRSEGEELAKQLGCPFIEITARERDSVVEAFSRLIREIDRTAEYKKDRVKKKPRSFPYCSVL